MFCVHFRFFSTIDEQDYNENRIIKIINSISTIDNNYDEGQTKASIHLSIYSFIMFNH
jgi:hypothetical protein